MTARALAALAAGVAASVALPPTSLPILPLAVASIFGLIAASRGIREAFVVGATASLGLFTLHILWLPASFSVLLGGAFWAVFPLLLAALALFWGGTAALARLLGRDALGTLAVLAPLWVLVEWVRGVGFIGFPWGSFGYGWMTTGPVQWADVVGVYGLSLLVTVSAAGLAAPFVGSWQSRLGGRVAIAVAAIALVAGSWWSGTVRGEQLHAGLQTPDRTALLVQGDVDPFGRTVSLAQELDVHIDLTDAAVTAGETPPDLVVWPEGAVLGFPLEGFRGEPARAAIQAASPTSAFVVGGRARVEGGSANAVYALSEASLTGRYDKHVLVPFGERWPLLEAAAPLYRAIFNVLGLPMLTNTVPGPGPAALPTGVGPIAAYVCYESVFPRISRQMVADGAEVLVNVTNDAWFARGSGAIQHFEMGRLRAIETRRWLLRAGNDGITGVVDPAGVVRATFPRGGRGTLQVNYAAATDLTPYVRYGASTPWVLLVATAVTSIGAWAPRRHGSGGGSSSGLG